MTTAGPATAVTGRASAGPIIRLSWSATPSTVLPATRCSGGSRSATSVYLPATTHALSTDETPSRATSPAGRAQGQAGDQPQRAGPQHVVDDGQPGPATAAQPAAQGHRAGRSGQRV